MTQLPCRAHLSALLPLLVCLLPVSTGTLHAQVESKPDPVNSEAWVRAHYTKYEFRIPMRDGTKLFVNAMVPQPGAFPDHGPYPFLVTRTPYSCGPYGEDHYPNSVTYSNELAASGYIFVCGDVRGRYASEGTFVEMRPHIDHKSGPQDVDDASDMYDTVDFLLKHVPGNNGKVGITGISYPGFFTSASIIDSHPAIKAASPQAPMTDLFLGADDSYHGGAFMLAAGYGFYTAFLPQQNPVDPRRGTRPALRLRHHRHATSSTSATTPPTSPSSSKSAAPASFPTRSTTPHSTATGSPATSPTTCSTSTPPS